MKKVISAISILGMCTIMANTIVNGAETLSPNGGTYLFNGIISEESSYHKTLFYEDFESEVNIKKRTDKWVFGGATITLENDGSARGKYVKMLAENGKRLYMQPHILAPEYLNPTLTEAQRLEKLCFECDVKMDTGAKAKIGCKSYTDLSDGYIADIIADSQWHTYAVEIDCEANTVTVYVDGEISEPLITTIENTDAVAVFGIYASKQEIESKYNIYIDNMKVMSASSKPQIEISGENEGEASFVLLPNEEATLIGAVYENGIIKEVKTIGAQANENPLKLCIPYKVEQGMEVKAFCLKNKETLIPVEKNISKNILAPEDCDIIKKEWRKNLVGDENNKWDNEYARKKLKEIDNTAKSVLDSMNTESGAAVLFGERAVVTTDDMARQYLQMYRLAKAYGTHGSALYKNEELKEKILYAMEWLYENLYGQDEINGTGWKSMEDFNWYSWYSEVPEYLMNTIIILDDEITKEQTLKYIAPFEYMHAWQSRGDNVGDRISRLSNSTALAVLKKDTALLRKNIDDLKKILPVTQSSDGYREDGMFIFHSQYPYTGLYGINTLAGTVLPVEKVLSSVSGAFTTEDRELLLHHLKNTYEPVVYKGRMMSMLMGRALGETEEKYEGLQVIRAILEIIDMYEGEDREYLESIIRRNIPDGIEQEYYLGGVDAKYIDIIMGILAEENSDPYESCHVYYSGDRVVQQKEEYAAGLSMSSERVPAYESINDDNKKGWFTGDGMLYIYTQDGYENQYTCDWWNNADMTRLPGTTEDTRERKEISISNTNTYKPPISFVGGAEYNNKYAVATMDFVGFNNEKVPTGSGSEYGGELEQFTSTLEAKKAWFMFDDEVVALGAGITSDDDAQVNTYLANFMLMGTEKETRGENYLHLDRMGGFFLPSGGELVTNKTSGVKSFFEMWLSHGVNPENETYSYVILPDKNAEETAAYAQNPDIEILSNTDKIQAAREKELGITGIVFHEAGSLENISVSQAIILIYDGETVKIADPTQKLDSVRVTIGTKTYTFDLSNCKGETLTKRISS